MLHKYKLLIYYLSELIRSFKAINVKYHNFCHEENVQYIVFAVIIIIVIIVILILSIQSGFFICLPRWNH